MAFNPAGNAHFGGLPHHGLRAAGIDHQAGGIALARKIRGETGRVWVMMSDGEFQEGQTWEALASLVHHRIDNLGVFVDLNGQQCDGTMESVMQTDPLALKLDSFGVRAFAVDGHDVEALAAPADLEPDGRPLVVLAVTDSCRGVELLRQRAPSLHYLRFKTDEERESYRDLYEKMVEEASSRPGKKTS